MSGSSIKKEMKVQKMEWSLFKQVSKKEKRLKINYLLKRIGIFRFKKLHLKEVRDLDQGIKIMREAKIERRKEVQAKIKREIENQLLPRKEDIRVIILHIVVLIEVVDISLDLVQTLNRSLSLNQSTNNFKLTTEEKAKRIKTILQRMYQL